MSVPELLEFHEDVLVDGLVEEGVPDRRDDVRDDRVVQVRRRRHLFLVMKIGPSCSPSVVTFVGFESVGLGRVSFLIEALLSIFQCGRLPNSIQADGQKKDVQGMSLKLILKICISFCPVSLRQ